MFANVERDFNVLLRGQGRNQVESLEDHPDLAVADRRQLALAHARDIDVIDKHRAGGRVVQAGNNTKQGALP